MCALCNSLDNGGLIFHWDQQMLVQQVCTYKHKDCFLCFNSTSIMCSFSFQMVESISLLALKITKVTFYYQKTKNESNMR